MAPNHDEQMNMRREKREAMRRKHQEEQRRLKIALIVAAIVLVFCGVGIFFLAQNAGNTPAQAVQATQPTTKPTEPKQQSPAAASQNTVTKIHLKAAGDLNVTNSVVDAGLSPTGYDYTRAFMDVAAVLADADVTVLNLEGNIYGEPYGTQRASAPAELLRGLRNVGVDMVQMANSYSINNGFIGLTTTLSAIRGSGIAPLGAYNSSSEFQKSGGYTICEIDGIRVAFVAFTKGVGGMGMPAGNEDCVNLLYTDYATTYEEIDRDGIRKILRSAEAEKPDITVAMLHWGSENNDTISKTQESIVSLMQKEGVDIILGTHPHLVQKIDYNVGTNTLVAYSLGDFFGDGSRGGTNYSIILDIEITKDSASGTTRITDYSYTPIYTLTETQCDGYRRVVRIEEAMLAYDGNFVDSVTPACYEDMKYSLQRIEERIHPKEETAEK